MLPPLKDIRAGLRRTTEAIAAELANPGSGEPAWSEVEWRLAAAAAVVHGVSPLLYKHSGWSHPRWRRFLGDQHQHVEIRHRRIMALLERIDHLARATGIPLVPLKGSALHALGVYAPGDRPMADIDLLVRERDGEAAARMMHDIGYVLACDQRRQRVFKPAQSMPPDVLGEHRDIPVNIELQTRICERLPVSVVDITSRIHPREPVPGLNPYPSRSALLAHLLLHAAGNVCSRSARLMHLHDIALLARGMRPEDWAFLRQGNVCWWALPPLRLIARYYGDVVPATVLADLAHACPPLLRTVSRHHTLTRVSCCDLLLHAFPGLEWSRGPRDALRFVVGRIRPSAETTRERTDLVRTQLWLKNQDWVVAGQGKRILTWLTRRVPRMDVMYAVRAALKQEAPAAGEKPGSGDVTGPSWR